MITAIVALIILAAGLYVCACLASAVRMYRISANVWKRNAEHAVAQSTELLQQLTKLRVQTLPQPPPYIAESQAHLHCLLSHLDHAALRTLTSDGLLEHACAREDAVAIQRLLAGEHVSIPVHLDDTLYQ